MPLRKAWVHFSLNTTSLSDIWTKMSCCCYCHVVWWRKYLMRTLAISSVITNIIEQAVTKESCYHHSEESIFTYYLCFLRLTNLGWFPDMTVSWSPCLAKTKKHVFLSKFAIVLLWLQVVSLGSYYFSFNTQRWQEKYWYQSNVYLRSSRFYFDKIWTGSNESLYPRGISNVWLIFFF